MHFVDGKYTQGSLLTTTFRSNRKVFANIGKKKKKRHRLCVKTPVLLKKHFDVRGVHSTGAAKRGYFFSI